LEKRPDLSLPRFAGGLYATGSVGDVAISLGEVVSGSGRSAQKSEKLAYFEPISETQFDEKIGIFFKKCGLFLIRRLQFL
jgi:hypothetical protein